VRSSAFHTSLGGREKKEKRDTASPDGGGHESVERGEEEKKRGSCVRKARYLPALFLLPCGKREEKWCVFFHRPRGRRKMIRRKKGGKKKERESVRRDHSSTLHSVRE